MRAGRARWRIGNEPFKPLKHPGYGFEHHDGHGRRHLATGFAPLMRRAFLIDQGQQRCCALLRAARAQAGSSGALWERLRGLCIGFDVPDWETLYQGIAFGHPKPDRVPFDTS